MVFLIASSYKAIYHASFPKKEMYSIMKKKTLFILIAAIVSPQVYAEDQISLAPLVITATRTEQSSFDLPVSIDVVSKKDIQDGQLQMTLSESLIRVPGITAQSRTQQSQDPQISTRGFGARSSFGVRGIRIYVDGIPLSMPDGSGTPGSADLSAIKSIEVMRGPFSALYGSSSGGVIQLLTEDAPKSPEIGAGVLFGSYDTKKETLRAAGSEGDVEYLLNVSNFESDGYRQNSASKKEQVTAKFKFNLTDATKISVLANWFDQDAQDPLGLKRIATASGAYLDPSAFSSPKAVPTVALAANTRVSRSNRQFGINLEHQLNQNNTINLTSYIGNRSNLQFLSTSGNSGTGRASQIERDFWGSDLHWTNKGEMLNRPYSLTAGLTYGRMHDDRMDIAALNGVMTAINNTNLNRKEINIASNFDQYIQGQWSILENVDLHAGFRRTKVTLSVEDNLIGTVTSSSTTFKFRNSSGSVSHEKTTPVVGAVWKITPAVNFYANFGKGFETPTFIEVSYDDKTLGTGPNFNLKPSTSDNYEAGLKAFVLDNTRLNVAVFRTNTENEIVAISGTPYAVYINAGKTKREGLELSIDSQLDHNIGLYAAYTFLNAKFNSTFVGSSSTPVASGNYIPGTYRNQFYGEVSWKAPSIGFSTAFEGRYNSKVYVDDVNSDFAPSYTVFNLRAGFDQKLNNWHFSEYARIENLFDKDYIGSVRVNDTNSRFFEPGAGRNWLLGLNASYSF
jgi:iron complex outermembrane receptor protein